jgi:hypothetical protein
MSILTKHSYSNPLYNTWKDMRKRCSNPNRKDYKFYGGKGIQVCDRWQQSFTNFLEDMLPTWFIGGTIERLDNDKGYCKENCTWVTISKQQQNRSNVKGYWKKEAEVKILRGKGLSQQKVADILNMTQAAVSRIENGLGPL